MSLVVVMLLLCLGLLAWGPGAQGVIMYRRGHAGERVELAEVYGNVQFVGVTKKFLVKCPPGFENPSRVVGAGRLLPVARI